MASHQICFSLIHMRHGSFCRSLRSAWLVSLVALMLVGCGSGGGGGGGEEEPVLASSPTSTTAGSAGSTSGGSPVATSPSDEDSANQTGGGSDANSDSDTGDDDASGGSSNSGDNQVTVSTPNSNDGGDSNSSTDSSMPQGQHQHSQGSGHCGMVPEFASTNFVTHRAAQSGPWLDPATWGGTLPGNGAVAQIPEELTVTVDGMVADRLETIRIDGTLIFAHDRDTEIQVDTLVSTCSGRLQIGTESQPIDVNATARVMFIDDGPVLDTQRVGRGAVLLGTTTIFGAAKTHKAVITPQARQGDTVINLMSAPSGWQVNDQLIITGTEINNPRSDEVRLITSINGMIVTLNQALNLDHTAPSQDLNVYVANATRNVEFVSENTAIQRRGHIMFMSANVNIRNARFTELGRTDKSEPLDDFEFEPHPDSGDDFFASADVIALGGDNRRGRYVLHFHQLGVDPNSTPALVQGSVVFNGPGWGFVNHSSHVHFIDNVAYGLQGAGFYTEAGNEIGLMQGNIAIRTFNPNFTLDDQGAIDPDLGLLRMDFGNDGDGYWFSGNMVRVINNVSAGASAHGFIYWTDGIMEATQPTSTRVTVNVQDLAGGELVTNRDTLPVWWAPLAENRGNESYGATVGFRSRYVNSASYTFENGGTDFHEPPGQAYIDTLNPEVRELTVWGNRDGVLLNYNEKMSLIDSRVVGFGPGTSVFSFNPGTAKSGIGLDVGNDATHGPAQVSRGSEWASRRRLTMIGVSIM